VTLVWTDPVASSSAGVQLVNDLDLTVYLPDCTAVHGNEYLSLDLLSDPNTNNWGPSYGVLSEYARVHGQPVDRVNNAERVWIDSAGFVSGHYRVEVSAYQLNSGNTQGYALVVNYGVKLTPTTSTCPALQYASRTSGLVDYIITASLSNAVSFWTPTNIDNLLAGVADDLDIDQTERIHFYNVTAQSGTTTLITFSILDVAGGPTVPLVDQNQLTAFYLSELFVSCVTNTASTFYYDGLAFISTYTPTTTPVASGNSYSSAAVPTNKLSIMGIVLGVFVACVMMLF